MERDCNTCKYSECWEYADPCLSCAGGNKWEIYTNADKIRSMTDEELADWLEPRTCQWGWLDWLRKEAE